MLIILCCSESDHEGKANKQLKGVAEEDALRKLLSSGEEDDDEEFVLQSLDVTGALDCVISGAGNSECSLYCVVVRVTMRARQTSSSRGWRRKTLSGSCSRLVRKMTMKRRKKKVIKRAKERIRKRTNTEGDKLAEKDKKGGTSSAKKKTKSKKLTKKVKKEDNNTTKESTSELSSDSSESENELKKKSKEGVKLGKESNR
ncbi:unnamed protein product [Timema podura]|uniref:Uncharacterized protein n=1 Tax=Timema podura TaxID=61482 RepID=A0ABN7P107_TIMPD|nr:unnamed protein product [Timema podura]